MGATNSTAIDCQHKEYLERTKEFVVDRSEAYLDFIEDTKAIVDLKIESLNKGIDEEVKKFFESSLILQLPANDRLTLETELCLFANMQKTSVRKMLASFRDTHLSFESLLNDNITNKLRVNSHSAAEEETSAEHNSNNSDATGVQHADSTEPSKSGSHFTQIVPEEELFAVGYSICDDTLNRYREELEEMKFPANQLIGRLQRFRRLLFKSFDLAITESLQLAIFERKESAIYRIDAAYRLGLEAGAFTAEGVNLCKDVIDHIIVISNEEVQHLLQMPVLHHGAIDIATRQVLAHAIQSVRLCQLCFRKDFKSLAILMDNEFDKFLLEEDGFATELVNRSSDESEKQPESIDDESEEDEEEQSVPPKRAPLKNANKKRDRSKADEPEIKEKQAKKGKTAKEGIRKKSKAKE